MDKKNIFTYIAENKIIHILLSIVLAFVVGAIFLAVMGLDIGVVYGRLLSSVTGIKGFSYVIVYSIPYIMTGLSVAFSFKTGVFNIGAEGQFVVGSMAAAVVGILFGWLPKGVLIPLCFIAAMLAGALWGLVVAFLKTKWGINEVLSMIMFNWIAFYLSNFIADIPAIHSDGSAEATKNISDNASTLLSKDFIKEFGLCPTANWGIIVVIVLTVVVWLVIDKTTLGYRLKAVGYNRFSAEYAGINVNQSILTAIGISGAIAGLGGALQLMGMGNRISVFSTAGRRRSNEPGGLRLCGHRCGADGMLQPVRRVLGRAFLCGADLRRQQAQPRRCPDAACQRYCRHGCVLYRNFRYLYPHQGH